MMDKHEVILYRRYVQAAIRKYEESLQGVPPGTDLHELLMASLEDAKSMLEKAR